MRTKGRLAFTLIAGMLVVVAAGCRPQTPPKKVKTPPASKRIKTPPAPKKVKAPPAPVPPAPPGMAVSGFWTSWGRPLRHCLAAHRARAGSRCHGALSIVIEKSKRRMVICCDGDPVKGYFIGLGRNPKGAKERRGDGRTPEGHYYLWRKNRQSRFYLSLGVSYPNRKDADRGLALGIIDQTTHARICRALQRGKPPPQNTRLGGNIYIHGGGMGKILREGGKRFVRVRDWTEGCVALRNSDMEELMAILPIGTPIEIRG
jgi:murein L,D-transpeptidase YafK